MHDLRTHNGLEWQIRYKIVFHTTQPKLNFQFFAKEDDNGRPPLFIIYLRALQINSFLRLRLSRG